MTNKYIKTDIQDLVVDPNNGAILNIDNSGLNAYRRQNQMIEDQKSNNERIQKLENDIGDIKEMLQQLLKR